MIKRIKKIRIYILLFILPALVIYTTFLALPLFNSLRLSFFTGATFTPTEFVGFGNYIKLFTQEPFNERFFNAIINTLKFFVIIIIIQNIIGFIFSILVTKKFFGAKFFRIVYYLPSTLSVIVVGFLFSLIFNPIFGAFDRILEFIGLDFLIRTWLGDPLTALPVIAVVAAWHHIGTPILFFTASIDGIPEEILEAARVDGVSPIGMVRYIVFPLLIPIIRLITILSFVFDFIAFDIIYAMATSRGNPDYTADLTGTFFYRTAFGEVYGAAPDMGLGTAVATILLCIVSIGIAFFFFVFRKKD